MYRKIIGSIWIPRRCESCSSFWMPWNLPSPIEPNYGFAMESQSFPCRLIIDGRPQTFCRANCWSLYIEKKCHMCGHHLQPGFPRQYFGSRIRICSQACESKFRNQCIGIHGEEWIPYLDYIRYIGPIGRRDQEFVKIYRETDDEVIIFQIESLLVINRKNFLNQIAIKSPLCHNCNARVRYLVPNSCCGYQEYCVDCIKKRLTLLCLACMKTTKMTPNSNYDYEKWFIDTESYRLHHTYGKYVC